jgi:hypothetical protein
LSATNPVRSRNHGLTRALSKALRPVIVPAIRKRTRSSGQFEVALDADGTPGNVEAAEVIGIFPSSVHKRSTLQL